MFILVVYVQKPLSVIKLAYKTRGGGNIKRPQALKYSISLTIGSEQELVKETR